MPKPKTRNDVKLDPLAPALEQPETDGLENALTGLGVYGRDKRESTNAVVDLMGYDALSVFYRANDLAARICDLPAEDMTREGFDVKADDDEELSEKIGADLEDLDVESHLEQAMKWQRLYGGAGILIGVNDGSSDLSRPINLDRVKSVDSLTCFDAWELRPQAWQENPLLPGFMLPTSYTINPHGMLVGIPVLQQVDASRIMRFCGPLANRRQLRQSNAGISQGWGDSTLLQITRLIRDYDGAWGGLGHLLQDFAQDIYKIAGLANALLADKDQTIKKRMQLINMSRSMIQATLLDKDLEDFETKTTSMAGIPEVMIQFMQRVSAAAGMTSVKLFGASPGGGLSGKGDSEDRSWYDKVKAMQKRQVKPQLNQLLKVYFASKEGATGGKEPENWSVQFRSLWQSTDVEKSAIRFATAQTAQIYVNLGAATAEDVAESHLSGDEFSLDLVVDLDRVAENAEAEAAVREATQNAAVGNLAEHGQATPPKPAPVMPPAGEPKPPAPGGK